MDQRIIVLLALSITAAALAGCTAGAPPAATGTPTPPPPPDTAATPPVLSPSPPATPAPADAKSCVTAADCVPAQCCHPTGCMNKAYKQVCTVMCTMSCEGPIDCGAGSCGCVEGRCSVVPAQQATAGQGILTSVRLEASPQRYSPIMSSTPGVKIAIKTTGITPSDAQFQWSAIYGHFLAWNPPDFMVKELGNPVLNTGESLYWSFVEKPVSTKDPVTVTVTARDTRSGTVLGSSAVTLNWDGDYAVYVGEIR